MFDCVINFSMTGIEACLFIFDILSSAICNIPNNILQLDMPVVFDLLCPQWRQKQIKGGGARVIKNFDKQEQIRLWFCITLLSPPAKKHFSNLFTKHAYAIFIVL